MTDSDRILIKLSEQLNPIDWAIADDYAKQAESKEAKDMIKSIATTLYHKEEFNSNLL